LLDYSHNVDIPAPFFFKPERMRGIGIIILVILLDGCKSINEFYPNHQFSLGIRNNILFVTVNLNGIPADFIIDTGASISLIDKNHAEKYGFKNANRNGTGQISGFGGNAEVTIGGYPDIEISGVELKSIKMYVTNLGKINSRLNEWGIFPVGILGADFLNKNKVIIDYYSRQIKFDIKEK